MRRISGEEAERGDVDGRARRSVRCRTRILDALGELVSEGNLQPTAQQVAARASVSLRTVFRHFDDMESLFREMRERLERVLRPILDEPLAELSLDRRIGALVRLRAKAFEKAAPFLRSGALVRWRSLFLSEAHDSEVRELRAQLLRALPELRDLSTLHREAVELVTSFEAWDRLRTDQRLGRERACSVVVETVALLLGARGTAG